MTGTRIPHCRWLSDLLTQHGDVDDVLEQSIAAHVDSCAECADDERRLAKLMELCRNDEPPEISLFLENRILDRICHGSDSSGLPSA